MTAGDTVQQIDVPGEVALPEVPVESRREGHNPTPSPAPSENSGDMDFFEVGSQSETETVDAMSEVELVDTFRDPDPVVDEVQESGVLREAFQVWTKELRICGAAVTHLR